MNGRGLDKSAIFHENFVHELMIGKACRDWYEGDMSGTLLPRSDIFEIIENRFHERGNHNRIN